MNTTQHLINAASSHQEEICELREENTTLKSVVQSQAARIAWFEKQLFGRKSEKRLIDSPQQFNLLTAPTATETPPE